MTFNAYLIVPTVLIDRSSEQSHSQQADDKSRNGQRDMVCSSPR